MNKTTKRSREYIERNRFKKMLIKDRPFWESLDRFREQNTVPVFGQVETGEYMDSYERLVHREGNPYKNEIDEMDI